jgi:hypothetical protein
VIFIPADPNRLFNFVRADVNNIVK